MMAAQMADRLAVQEQEIRSLNEEIGLLLELGLSGIAPPDASPTLEQLRAENEKLRYRLGHLQRSLKEEEQARGTPEADSGLQGPGVPETDNGEPGRPREEKSEGERAATHQNKKKKEKKSGSDVNGLKPEGSLPCGNGVVPENGQEGHLHPPGSCSSSCQGPLPELLHLFRRREYLDTRRRPWKVVFPHDDMLKEPAGSMILLRGEQQEELGPLNPVSNTNNHWLPSWLEQQGGLCYTSAGSTWNVLFRDPSQDNYLLLLKKDRPSLDCSKNAARPLSLHTLKCKYGTLVGIDKD